MKCRICGDSSADYDNMLELRGHQKEAHPGERSPTSRPRAPRPPRSAPAATPNLTLGLEGEPQPGSEAIGPEIPPELAPNVPDEFVPEPSKPSWRERLWGGTAGKLQSTGERAPRRFKHESTATLLGGAWGGIGSFLVRFGSQLDQPTGRMLQYQAPVAGEILEKITADTWFDRVVLQPIARNTDNAEMAAALFGLPALVFLYPRVPAEARPTLEPFMQEAVRAHIHAMVPVIKKKRARDREDAKVLEDMRDEGLIDPEIATITEAIDAVLMMVFTGKPAAEGAPEAPAADPFGVGDREAATA